MFLALYIIFFSSDAKNKVRWRHGEGSAGTRLMRDPAPGAKIILATWTLEIMFAL